MSTESRARLRELLGRKQMTVAPFVFDCLQAKLAEQAGFEAVYMTGFGTSAARGFPDLGLITMSEMAANVRALIATAGAQTTPPVRSVAGASKGLGVTALVVGALGLLLGLAALLAARRARTTT